MREGHAPDTVTVITVDAPECPDEFNILPGIITEGDTIECQTCQVQHRVIQALTTDVVDIDHV
ncbi:hypothetical protein [Actinopolyspora halophila]|uniref:hypothetical protein n=1 Tax=Actinopolyspora halophila TaxID=1850 RepID=UPI00036235CA|nr:hypothetical protein [Actinopolyspora halophila]